jgi:hypothetical protein
LLVAESLVQREALFKQGRGAPVITPAGGEVAQVIERNGDTAFVVQSALQARLSS